MRKRHWADATGWLYLPPPRDPADFLTRLRFRPFTGFVPVVNDLDRLQGGQSALKKLIEYWEKRFDFFGAIDDFNNDGQIHREA